MREVVIVAAVRTAIGTFNGSLKGVPAHALGAAVMKEVLVRTGVDAADINDVIMGQVLTTAQGQNPARQAAMAAGIPQEKTALTINQVCGSGLRSVMLAAQSIMAGQAEIVLAGGQENMSMAPHAVHLRDGVRMGPGELKDTMIVDGLWDAFNDYHMGMTAENIAEQFKITRAMQDEFAVASQTKAAAAIENNRFAEEIVPVELLSKLSGQRKGDPVIFNKDEFPRLSPLEKVAGMRTAFKKDGTVTAANASGINDGAAVCMVMAKEEAEQRGIQPMATIKSFATCGVDPAVMGTGPIPASQKALELAGWTHGDLDLIEANEAFAAQAACVNQEMGWDENKVNVNGGAIALGHPIGASGTRCLVTLLHEMEKRDAKKGLVTLCIGGGQGVALTVER